MLNSYENFDTPNLESNAFYLESNFLHETEMENNQVYSKWLENDVESWLKEKMIHPDIGDSILPADGKLLYEIFLMKSQAPNFLNETFLMKNPTFFH